MGARVGARVGARLDGVEILGVVASGHRPLCSVHMDMDMGGIRRPWGDKQGTYLPVDVELLCQRLLIERHFAQAAQQRLV